MPVVLVGVVLISGVVGADAYGEDPASVCVFGLRTSVAYAGFLLLLRQGSHDLRRVAGPLFDATAGGAVLSAAVGPVGGVDLVPSWPSHGWLLGAGAHVPGPRLAADLGVAAAGAGCADLGDPAAAAGRAVALSAAVLAERPSPVQLAGCVIVLVGVVAATARRRRASRRRRRRAGAGQHRRVNLVVRHIGRLLTMTGEPVPDAALVVTDGRVAWTGPAGELPADAPASELDAAGACVVPGFVDAHTHLVFAGVRRDEFVARLAGVAYDGGGIRTTVAATRAATDDELLDLARARAASALAHGTTTMEVKTRLRADRDEELRLLDVIGGLAARTPVRLEATYLGAHVVPAGRDRDDYVDEVVATLPAAAAAGARWCDVFCDQGVFTVEEARRMLTAARERGTGSATARRGDRAHRRGRAGRRARGRERRPPRARDARGRQGDGRRRRGRRAAAHGHLSLRSQAWGHAAVLRDAGVELALATDCNPGTSWCESMPYAIQLACLAMGLSVDEAFRAATLGAARSLRRDDVGHLGVGARGDLAVLDAEHEADVVAHLGGRAVAATVVGGARHAG